jgi:hypothetical protein
MSVRYFGAVGYVLLFTVLYYLLMTASAATGADFRAASISR